MTNPVYEKLLRCYESCKDRVPFVPKIAMVLGSGLGNYADQIDMVSTLPYGEIAEFPQSTVSGHKGQFVFGYVKGIPVVIMQGRVHYYEGYPITDVVLPVRLMKMMGAEMLFLTNAAGGVNWDFEAGNLMLITDHISNFVPSPLIGPNIDELGTRFPDCSAVYNKAMCQKIREAAWELGIDLKEGTYVQLTGPNYETPMEVKMVRLLGGDAVGMSTACEAMAANHMGMKVCGISCITNMGCGMLDQPLNHDEVKETADRVAKQFEQLVTLSVEKIGSL